MSQIGKLISQLCPRGVDYVALEALFDLRKGKNLTNEQAIPGEYPVVTASRGSTFFHNDFNFDGKCITISSHGAYAGYVSYYDQKFWLGNNVYLFESKAEEISTRFYFHVLKSLAQALLGTVNTGGIPYINAKDLRRLRVPYPPIEIQNEIVRILDTFMELETELETELEARLKQRIQVIDWLQAGKLPQLEDAIEVPLSELVYFENGKPHEPLVDPLGGCELITAKFIASNGTLARRINYDDIRTSAHLGDITIVLSDLPNGRALAKCYFIQRDDYYAVNQRIAILRSKDVAIANPEYLYHYVSRNPQILKFDDGSTQTHLKKANVVDMIVRLPPLQIQVQIARALTALEKFVFEATEGLPAEIEARHKQYEYYRSKLLSFKELEVA